MSPMHRTLAALLAFTFSAFAADQAYVLKAARMFDGKSDHVVSPGLMVVANGKIVGVGPSAAIPAGAETIDLGDATLLPGFMDAHTHLTYPYRARLPQQELDVLKKTIPERDARRRRDRAQDADGGLHDGPRRRRGRLHRRRPAQCHQRRQDSRTAHAGGGPRARRDRRPLRLLGRLRPDDLRPRKRHHRRRDQQRRPGARRPCATTSSTAPT